MLNDRAEEPKVVAQAAANPLKGAEFGGLSPAKILPTNGAGAPHTIP